MGIYFKLIIYRCQSLGTIQIRLTEKVRKAAGIASSDLVDADVCMEGLGSWTVNLFNQDRRKALVFVNDRTLYSLILFGARKEHYRNLPTIFRRALNQLLLAEGVSDDEISLLMQGTEAIAYTKTDSKKVLGNVNELVSLYRSLISDCGGIQQ